MTKKTNLRDDITDSPEDQEKLKPDQGILQIPDLKDLPGNGRQETNWDIYPNDTTISSSDEEGDDLFNEDPLLSESDVSPLEKKLLGDSLDVSYDRDLPAGSLSLDDEDNEGDPLEEKGQAGDLFGKDLDDGLILEEDEESEGESQQ